MKKNKIASLVLAGLMVFSISACSKDTVTPKGEVKVEGTEVSIKKMAGSDLDKIMEDAKKKEEYTVIDVRSADEYEAGHVKFAINIPVDDIENKVSVIEDLKDKNVVTICNTGKKSMKAAEALVKKGFKNVYDAEGVKSFKYTTMTKVTNIRAKELQEMVNSGKYTVIDARDAKAFAEGHLKNAINVTKEDLDSKLSSIPTDKPVLTYCFTGNKSMDVAQKLVEKNYKVFNSLDGTKEYDKFELVK